MTKLILRTGNTSSKDASSDPAANQAYIDRMELGRLRAKKCRDRNFIILHGHVPLPPAKQALLKARISPVLDGKPWPPYQLVQQWRRTKR